MNTKPPRPENSYGSSQSAGDWNSFGGSSNSQNSEAPDHAQDRRTTSDTVPLAFTRLVVGRTYSFVYIEDCPLCGLEHAHAQTPHGDDPLQPYTAFNGYR